MFDDQIAISFLKPALEFIAYLSGLVLVSIFSFGRLRVEPLVSEKHRANAKPRPFFFVEKTGKRLLTMQAAILVGFIFWCLLFLVIFLIGNK